MFFKSVLKSGLIYPYSGQKYNAMKNNKLKECYLEYRQWSRWYYHLTFDSIEDGQLFHNDDEFADGMNGVAVGQFVYGLSIIAFSLMVNHCHVLLCGTGEDIVDFFIYMKRRINDKLREDGYPSLPRNYGFHLAKIEDEKQLANTVSYIARNPMKARPDIMPSGYLWGSSFLIFSDIHKIVNKIKLGEISDRKKKQILRTKCRLPDDYVFNENMGYILPESYVLTSKAEKVLGTSRRFSSDLIRNIDAFIKIDEGIGERAVLSEDDVNELIYQNVNEMFNVNSVNTLNIEEKCRLAVQLKKRYRLDNKRIARKLKLDLKIVEDLFE